MWGNVEFASPKKPDGLESKKKRESLTADVRDGREYSTNH